MIQKQICKNIYKGHSHLECNSEVFQWLLMEVFLVKEQQQLKNTPVRR